MFSLNGDEVPEWRSGVGDRMRVVVGSFKGLASPLVPTALQQDIVRSGFFP